jgi:hypothetical protein
MFGCLAGVAVLGSDRTVEAQTNSPANPPSWKLSGSIAVKELYDSNVYLQSQTSLANQESLVTTVIPQIVGNWNPSPALNAVLSYTPEVAWYHSESSENNVTHRGLLNLSGRADKTAYELGGTVVLIDGSSIGPTWTGQGGAPAAGGIPVRDRRDATVYRSNFRLTPQLGRWFVRPAATFYFHDFRTEQSSATGYQNYVDRSEVTGGLDLGVRLSSVSVWAGYRYGFQDQAQLLQYPEVYDNTFNRVLFGVEGTLVSWLKMNIVLGPEFRRYGAQVPATFGDHNVLNVFADASLTFLPTKQDTMTLSVRQFQQPGFSGRSAYDDLTCDLAWRHKFNDSFTVGASGRAYNTDFLYPVIRDDWIYSGSAFINWCITKQWNVEASYSYEAGESLIVNTSGRDYSRHLVALGLKYNFPPLPRSKPQPR